MTGKPSIYKPFFCLKMSRNTLAIVLKVEERDIFGGNYWATALPAMWYSALKLIQKEYDLHSGYN